MTSRRLLVLFLFCLLLVNVDSQGYPCPAPGQVYATCTAVTLYLIDASLDLSASQIRAEFNFSRYKILPGIDWGQYHYVVFFTYGAGGEQDFLPNNNRIALCDQLSNLEYEYNQATITMASLYLTLTSINSHYSKWLTNIVIFTGNKDTEDINYSALYASVYMKQVGFTVVALNGSLIDEATFPATVYHVNDLNNPPQNLEECVIKSACGLNPNCNINETMPTGPTFPPTPSTRSTSRMASPSTARPTTPPTPSTSGMSSTPSTATPASSSLQCQCDTMSAWVDIMFVMDASASTGEMGLDEMWGMAGTMLELFNVQETGYTASQYTSRVGIITYGNTANVLYPLGSLDNDRINDLLDLPFNDEPMTNLEAGLQAAVAQFNGPNHRSNARWIIIVMAAAFDPEGTNAPNKTATTIKENGGILMVFNYVPENGIESPMLASLASPGYFFSTTLNSHYTDIALGLCDANCFCRDNLHAYGLSTPRRFPTKGCYADIFAESNYARALNNCKSQYYNGTLTTDEDSAKTAFLKGLFPSGNSFYIGLAYDNIDRTWEWPDGTTPGSYQPWVGGKASDGSSQQCVYVDSNSQWQPVDCRSGYPYVCEVTPCDSVHYCA